MNHDYEYWNFEYGNKEYIEEIKMYNEDLLTIKNNRENYDMYNEDSRYQMLEKEKKIIKKRILQTILTGKFTLKLLKHFNEYNIKVTGKYSVRVCSICGENAGCGMWCRGGLYYEDNNYTYNISVLGKDLCYSLFMFNFLLNMINNQNIIYYFEYDNYEKKITELSKKNNKLNNNLCLKLSKLFNILNYDVLLHIFKFI